MEITYRREMKHNYLIIEPDEAGYDSYEVYMMAANGIEGLLRFHIKQIDNRKYYYYEITSKQPLNRVLEYHSLGDKELKRLIGGIEQILGRLAAYLLQEKQILLEPEYIYIEPEHFSVFLCLVPGRQGVFPEEMTGLLRYLLGKVNHQDKECVVMAYGLYQESLKENYGLKDLLDIIGKNNAHESGDDEIIQTADNHEFNKDHDSLLSNSLKKETDQVDTVNDENKEVWDFIKIGKGVITSIAVMIVVTTVIWLCFGTAGIRKFWFSGVLAGMICMITVLISAVRESRLQKERNHKEPDSLHQKEESYEWQMIFEEGIKDKVPETEEEEILQTVLLTDTTAEQDVRYLRAAGAETEDIAVSYVPFLIGKQEGLVDYVLDKDTVSRIHARIDREGEEYRISDLNSTNGTSVNGRLLETNETLVLKTGDEVFIANYAFVFT